MAAVALAMTSWALLALWALAKRFLALQLISWGSLAFQPAAGLSAPMGGLWGGMGMQRVAPRRLT
jgi:hypothetical protein